jgi:hypothetical protein
MPASIVPHIAGDANHVVILGQQHTAVTAPADTAENTLYSLVIPGGLMGPNDSLRVTFAGSQTSNTNVKTWFVRLGGVQLGARAAASTAGLRAQLVVSNRNSLSNQIVGVGSALNTPFTDSAPVTASVNTAVNQTLTISASKASGADSLTLESVLVELIRGV